MAVKVVSAEGGVSVGRLDLYKLFAYLKDGHVKCPPAEVVNHYFPVALIVKPVGERGGGRLVDYSLNFEPSNFARVFCRLPLAVIKIGGNGYHGFGDFRAGVALRRFFEFHKHMGRNLRGRVLFASRLYPCVSALGRGDHRVREFAHKVFYLFQPPSHKAFG